MFAEVQPRNRFRSRRAVVVSICLHLALLAAIAVRRSPVIQVLPAELAYGAGTKSYRVIYSAPGEEDASAASPKLTLSSTMSSPRLRPRATTSKAAREHLQLPADAEAAIQNSRAGSPLGTLIDGPITGHVVQVAYPVVFPDPPVARAELPTGLQGDVIVEITIDAQGNVVETKVVEAIGHGIDEKIVATLQQWHFHPATLDGTPVASKHDVHFHFPS